MMFTFLLLGSLAFSAVAGDYAREALEAHNEYRGIHDASPLRLNSQLSNSAASYARKLARLGRLKHSDKKTRPGIGENLIYRCSSRGDPLPARMSVKDLYDEICQYDFAKPGFYYETGHFTQIVWKDSKELGVGTATGRKRGMKCLYVVFRYKKTGNITNRGYFQKNVVRGSFRRSYCNNVSVKDEPEMLQL